MQRPALRRLSTAAAAVLACLSCTALGRVEPRLLMGLQTSHLGAIMVINSHAVEAGPKRDVSLHIIIPSMQPYILDHYARHHAGRRSLFRLLESLEPQLQPRDHVTISFDGQDREDIFAAVTEKLKKMPGDHEAIMEREAQKTHGNPLRNKYRAKKGDFVMFADDDNWYMPDALESVRAHAQHDLDGLFLFQMQHAKTGTIVPDILGWGEVEVGNVDSGCGVVPVRHVHLSDWLQDDYVADGLFYKKLAERLPRTYFVPKVIYMYSGGEGERATEHGHS